MLLLKTIRRFSSLRFQPKVAADFQGASLAHAQNAAATSHETELSLVPMSNVARLSCLEKLIEKCNSELTVKDIFRFSKFLYNSPSRLKAENFQSFHRHWPEWFRRFVATFESEDLSKLSTNDLLHLPRRLEYLLDDRKYYEGFQQDFDKFSARFEVEFAKRSLGHARMRAIFKLLDSLKTLNWQVQNEKIRQNIIATIRPDVLPLAYILKFIEHCVFQQFLKSAIISEDFWRAFFANFTARLSELTANDAGAEIASCASVGLDPAITPTSVAASIWRLSYIGINPAKFAGQFFPAFFAVTAEFFDDTTSRVELIRCLTSIQRWLEGERLPSTWMLNTYALIALDLIGLPSPFFFKYIKTLTRFGKSGTLEPLPKSLQSRLQQQYFERLPAATSSSRKQHAIPDHSFVFGTTARTPSSNMVVSRWFKTALTTTVFPRIIPRWLCKSGWRGC